MSDEKDIKQFDHISTLNLNGEFYPDKDNPIPNGQLDTGDFDTFFNVEEALSSSVNVNKTIKYLSLFDKFDKQKAYEIIVKDIIDKKLTLIQLNQEEIDLMKKYSHAQNTDNMLTDDGVDLPAKINNKGKGNLRIVDFCVSGNRVASIRTIEDPEHVDRSIPVFDGYVKWDKILGRVDFEVILGDYMKRGEFESSLPPKEIDGKQYKSVKLSERLTNPRNKIGRAHV